MTKKNITSEEAVYPKAVVFDLDYTLWRKFLFLKVNSDPQKLTLRNIACWCDTHIYPPLKLASKDGTTLKDKHGYQISFYTDVPDIITELKDNGVKIIAASRTCTPAVARKMLQLLRINNQSSINLFDHLEFGTHSKIRHFRNIHSITDIPYDDMVFFDDESRNRDVEKELGVHFVYVYDEDIGITRKLFEQGLKQWRSKANI